MNMFIINWCTAVPKHCNFYVYYLHFLKLKKFEWFILNCRFRLIPYYGPLGWSNCVLFMLFHILLLVKRTYRLAFNMDGVCNLFSSCFERWLCVCDKVVCNSRHKTAKNKNEKQIGAPHVNWEIVKLLKVDSKPEENETGSNKDKKTFSSPYILYGFYSLEACSKM